jgi:CRP-like cAMP-binding protein
MSFDLESLLATRRTIAPGELIFLEAQLADCAYLVLKGEVQIVAGQGGRASTLLNRIHSGELFGEIALLQDGFRSATALSKDGCELLVLDKAVFADKLEKADPFLKFVVDHLCRLILTWTDRATRRESGTTRP